MAIPGTPNLRQRIGGIEKEDGSGNISYDPTNHAHMVEVRAERVKRVKVPDIEVAGDPDAEILVVGWGSTWGSITSAMGRVRSNGHKVAHAHLSHLNPFPKNLGEILEGRTHILVPEMNLGQLSLMLRAGYLVDDKSISKVAGQPFTAGELEQTILEYIEGKSKS